MVQSLYSGKKPDGDKVTTSRVGLVGPSGSQSARETTTTTTSTGRTGFSEQQIARSGSGGSDCLFSRSTEELLDLDLDLELRSDLHRQTASYHNGNVQNIANNFSIDDQYKSHSSNNHSSAGAKSCCFSIPSSESLNWKRISRWSSNLPNQLDRVAKMPVKRHYMIMFCLVLVILSCLLASLAISRRVGDLDGDGDNTGSGSSLKLGSSLEITEELEPRSIDLVDLIESGKTFAFAKYRIQVKVPRSRASYEQHPSFLLHPNPDKPVDAEQQSAPVGNSVTMESSQNKYFLTSMRESTSADELDKSLDALNKPPVSQSQIHLNPKDPNNLLGLDIKPVNLAKGKNDAATPGIEDIAALLAMTTTGERRTEALGFIADNQNRPTSSKMLDTFDQLDPIDQAASEMNLSLQAINKTLIDCFLVDTEKRYDQKIVLEDIHRQVASTRRVSFKTMMDVILECRKLTWASLPNAIRIKSIPGEQPLVVAASAHTQSTTPLDISTAVLSATRKPAQQSHDIIGNLLGSWFHYGATSEPAASKLTSAARQPKPDEVDLSESRNQPTSLFQQDQNQQRQASFLNMGISMVNGIIPNTLWCGLGDRAANYSELGAEYKVDACCRAHDHCPVRLKPFTTDYGLVNWSMSTRSHCNCDVDFNDCLLAVNSTLSNVIKVLYFRFVGLQCIDVENRQSDEHSTHSP